MSSHCMRWVITSVVIRRFDAEHAAGELQVHFHCGVQNHGRPVVSGGARMLVAWRGERSPWVRWLVCRRSLEAGAGLGSHAGRLLILDAFLAQVRVAGWFCAGRAYSLFHHPRPFAIAILVCWTMRASVEGGGFLSKLFPAVVGQRQVSTTGCANFASASSVVADAGGFPAPSGCR